MERKLEQSPRVTMSTLGRNGKFGNQILQYIFLKVYSKKYGLEIEIPWWIGNDLFNLNDNRCTNQLPLVYEFMHEELFNYYWLDHFQKLNVPIQSGELNGACLLHESPPFQNVDLWGYFTLHFAYYSPYKEYIQSLLQPSISVSNLLEEGMNKLKSQGKTIVGIHIRRGDFLIFKNTDKERWFYTTSTDTYKKLLNEIWNSLVEPVLFIASDDPEVIQDFKEYCPISSVDLFQNLPSFLTEFYTDFHVLSNCDIMAISNSTFSFTASILNKNGKKFYRPTYKPEKLIEFDPWNSTPTI